MQHAWNIGYVGGSATQFIKILNETSRGYPYCNNIPFVQSSGTGKSRMLREASKQVFSVHFSLGISVTDAGMGP